MSKILLSLILSLIFTGQSWAYLTSGYVAVTKTSSASGVSSDSQNSSIQDNGTTVSTSEPFTSSGAITGASVNAPNGLFGALSLTGPIFSTNSLSLAGLATLSGGASVGSINGILKGSSGTLSAATNGTDYSSPSVVETLTNKTFDTALNTFKFNGTTYNASPIGSGSLVLATSIKGNSGIVATAGSGTFTPNDCVKFDSNGNVADNGSACGSGGGMTYPASAGIVVSTGSAWATSLGAAGLNNSYVNWTDINKNSSLGSGGVNWQNFNKGNLNSSGVNWQDFNVNPMLGAGGVNWQNMDLIASGTHYSPATSGSTILAGNGSGGYTNVTTGTGINYSGGVLSNKLSVTSFVAQSSVSVALASGNVYKVMIVALQNTSNSNPTGITFNSDSTSGHYQWVGTFNYVGNATITPAGSGSTTLINVVQPQVASQFMISMDVSTITNNASIISNASYLQSNDWTQFMVSGLYNTSTTVTSMQITASAGTMTGTIYVYQLN